MEKNIKSKKLSKAQRHFLLQYVKEKFVVGRKPKSNGALWMEILGAKTSNSADASASIFLKKPHVKAYVHKLLEEQEAKQVFKQIKDIGQNVVLNSMSIDLLRDAYEDGTALIRADIAGRYSHLVKKVYLNNNDSIQYEFVSKKEGLEILEKLNKLFVKDLDEEAYEHLDWKGKAIYKAWMMAMQQGKSADAENFKRQFDAHEFDQMTDEEVLKVTYNQAIRERKMDDAEKISKMLALKIAERTIKIDFWDRKHYVPTYFKYLCRNENILILNGGRGKGASIHGLMEFIRLCMYREREGIALVRATYHDAAKGLFDMAVNIINNILNIGHKFHISLSPKKITCIETGSFMVPVGAKLTNGKSGMLKGVDGIIHMFIDEADEVAPDVERLYILENAFNSLRVMGKEVRPVIIMTHNSIPLSHPLVAKYYVNPEKYEREDCSHEYMEGTKNVCIVHSTLENNTFLSEDNHIKVRAREVKEKNFPLWQRMYGGKLVNPRIGLSVMGDSFDFKIHVPVDRVAVDASKEITLSIDINDFPYKATGLFQGEYVTEELITETGTIKRDCLKMRMFKEYSLIGGKEEDVVNAVCADLRPSSRRDSRSLPWLHITGDTPGNVVPFAQLTDKFRSKLRGWSPVCFYFKPKRTGMIAVNPGTKRDAIEFVEKLLAGDIIHWRDGEKKTYIDIEIDSLCSDTIRELENLVWNKEQTDIEKPKGTIKFQGVDVPCELAGHHFDMFVYAMISIFEYEYLVSLGWTQNEIAVRTSTKSKGRRR